MIKIFQYDEVPLDVWINSYILYSKALFLSGKIDSSLELLGFCVDIFPFFPIEDLKYVGDIQKNKKNKFKSNIFDQEIFGSFYNRMNIFNKCSKIFKENSIFEDPTEKDKQLYDYDYKESNFDDNYLKNKNLFSKIFDEKKEIDMNNFSTRIEKHNFNKGKTLNSSKIKEENENISNFSLKKNLNSNYLTENLASENINYFNFKVK
jgi:hypothetical protein